MVQVSLARGWNLDIERGPDWLFVRPRRRGIMASKTPPLAEHVWFLLEQNFTYRLVLEMSDIDRLDSYLIGQLAWLQKQIQAHEGMIRICGLSSGNQEILQASKLDSHFAPFRDREEAVMGQSRPKQPR